MKTKAVIYSRISTNQQNDLSQIEDLKKYAELNNFDIVASFGETVSGFDLTKERFELQKAKDFVIQNNIKNILIWELSRLGRNSLHTLTEIDYFKKLGINIFFKKEGLNTLSNDPTNVLLLSVISSMAQMERSNIVERSHRGKISSAEKGKRIGFAIMPYGFQSNKGFIEINEDEAKIVRDIYDMAIKGISIKGIASHLNSLNIPTRNTLRGKKRTLKNKKQVTILWRSTTISKILKSTLYKGERTFLNSIKIKIPQIIEENTWDLVQQRFENKIGYRNNTQYEYLFKSKIFCGKCGLAYLTRTENRYPSKPSFYFCSGRKDKAIQCKNGQFNSKIFDDIIYDLLFRHHNSMLKVHQDNIAKFDLNSKNKQIEFFKGEIVKQEARRKKSISLYKDDEIDESEFKSDIATIRNTIIDNENHIRKIENEIKSFEGVNMAQTLTSFLWETDFNSKLDFVRQYVDRIDLYKVENCNIDFTGMVYHPMKSKTIHLKNPNGNDKLIYVELFAFGSPYPLKATLSNVSNIIYTSETLKYDKEIELLTIK